MGKFLGFASLAWAFILAYWIGTDGVYLVSELFHVDRRLVVGILCGIAIATWIFL